MMTGVSSYMNIIYNLITKTEAPNFKKLLCCISRLQLLGNYLNPQLQVHKEIGIVLVSINFFVIKFFFFLKTENVFTNISFPERKKPNTPCTGQRAAMESGGSCLGRHPTWRRVLGAPWPKLFLVSLDSTQEEPGRPVQTQNRKTRWSSVVKRSSHGS